MRAGAVDHLTRRLGRAVAWTPAERRAVVALAIAWGGGAILSATGAHEVPARWARERLSGGLVPAAVLADRLPPADPRLEWYAAGLALRAERERAASGPVRLDPNAAGRADWDRLPGIGPRTAEAILETRARRGPFRSPEDLLEVRGIGPKTLERLRPWLAWPAGVPPAGGAIRVPARPVRDPRPDLNRVDEGFLAGLSNIGPYLARIILRERGRRGGFRDWAEVDAIEGVGPSRMAVLQNATRIPNPRPTGEMSNHEEQR